MDEILGQLSGMIEKMARKRVVVGLKGPGGEATALLDSLLEGIAQLRGARASFRQTQSLLVKGHGKLVEPKGP